ncbi:MAG TPA: site-2 protease family protein [Kofleriaceae bacterium]
MLYVLILLISVALHEFGHAFMADRLGDDTPRRQGRVTLNPLAHADLIGTIALPLLGGFLGGGFGWGKPVQWQPHRVSRRISMSTAKILVSVAGPAMNLVLGTVLALVHTILVSQHVIDGAGPFSQIFWAASTTNYVLFFFNLLPVPPLDGGHVAQSFLPYRYRNQYAEVARYAPFALLAVMFIPQLRLVFLWPANQVTDLVYHGFGHLFGPA